MTSLAESTIVERLRADLDGRVIAPGDEDYDGARTVFMGGIDRRPAAIARPLEATDVARVVTIAREAGLPLAVRGGGHSGAGHGVVDDGIVIDLRDMRALAIDPEARTASAQAGLTAGEYTEAAARHGLATGFGDTGSVGIAGITLGGGIGFLSRLHGLTIDNLLAAEVVTAEGEILDVDADRHADLFWAIRGGGGNFGVATRFEYRLREVPGVYGGMLMLPASTEVLETVLAAAADAPEELSAIVNVMPAPPMPFVPEDRQGELVVLALLCFAGPEKEGEQAVAPFRSAATPIADMVGPVTYPELFQPEPEDYHPKAVFRNLFVGDIDGDTATRVVERLQAADGAMRVMQFRVLGGAIADVANDATAYAHRDARIMTNVVSFYEDPSGRAAAEEWTKEVGAELPGGETSYVNFLGPDPERVRAAYPGRTWDRLVEIKARYDPDNLFRSNQNIPPR